MIVKVFSTFLILSLSVAAISCNDKTAVNKIDVTENQTISEENLSVAYFASGCFWCVEAVFQSVKGVKDAVSGYSGGEVSNPTYQQVSSGQLKHAEAVKVLYDPDVVDFKTLVDVFFGSHDPTTLNRQGPDAGPQYRSIAFYQNQKEKDLIEMYIQSANESQTFGSDIVTEVVPFEKFWKAEEYHQEYERLHPENPYVQNVSIPRLNRFKKKFPHLLKENH